MSRSKHTDPKAIRATRRVRMPRGSRGFGDLSQRRRVGSILKRIGLTLLEQRRGRQRDTQPRVIVKLPRSGFHHPAGKKEILNVLNAFWPLSYYGVRSIELRQTPANTSASALLFGRYSTGRIVLFEQPLPPWRFPGLLKNAVVTRLKRAGAVLTTLTEADATIVDWPNGTLRNFMLEEVLLHELGHHVLQHHKGKRTVRIARTSDHESFARRFAEKRLAMLKGRAVES
jgi:hypothetical protein